MKRFNTAVLIFVILMAGALGAWYWPTNSPDSQTLRPAARNGRRPPFKSNLTLRPATALERQSAIRSIQGQLDAFRRNDYESAIKYQSQALHRNFASPQVFQSMIEGSYPQFADYKSVIFGPATALGKDKNATIAVPIILIGQDGVKVEATYMMTKEYGAYRVSGVSGGSRRGSGSGGPGNRKHPPLSPGFEKVAPLIT